jgi:hypothetical protein
MVYIRASTSISYSLNPQIQKILQTKTKSTHQSINMSDTGRKGVGEQLKEKATPQDQKVLHPHLSLFLDPI